MSDTVKTISYKYAVKNAFEHEGNAQMGAVIGKVKALFPETDLKKIAPEVSKIVLEVNKMKKEKLDAEYKKFDSEGWELKHVEKEKTLPELTWLSSGEKLITRVAPNPSGAMHFGHSRPAVLTDEYVKKYGGKITLRFDDTDPKTKTPVEGIEKEFIKDFEWLGIKFDEVSRSSDKLERYYEVIEKLLSDGNAYVCFCESESWRKLIWESKPCPCRKKTAKEQFVAWKKMLAHEIKEEEAVVRIKTNLKDPDPSTRDWWMAKVVDTVTHTNKKMLDKHVWPSYNLASAVDDHDMGVNFVIRGQEHVANGEKQKEMYDLLEWKNFPHTEYFGKISKLGDMTLSKSKMKLIMDEKGLETYDDPRMATIMSFRRRGFTAEAIRQVIINCGVSMKEVKITIENFASTNKAVLGEVNEFPFFEEAAEMEVYNLAPGEGECYGEKVNFDSGIMKIFVDKKELLKYKNKKDSLVRFKKAFNAKITEANEFQGKAMFISYSKTDYQVISWIDELIDVEILMNDGTTKRGFSATALLKANGVVHFEGVGYANIEKKEDGKVKCVYAYE